jgi:hypothetical protein
MEKIEREAMTRALEYANTLIPPRPIGFPIHIPDAIAVLEKQYPSCILTKVQEKEIMDKYRGGKYTFEQLATEYGCSVLQAVRIWENA